MQVGLNDHYAHGVHAGAHAPTMVGAGGDLSTDQIVSALMDAARNDAVGGGMTSLRDLVDMLAKALTPLIIGQMLRMMDQQMMGAAPGAQPPSAGGADQAGHGAQAGHGQAGHGAGHHVGGHASPAHAAQGGHHGGHADHAAGGAHPAQGHAPAHAAHTGSAGHVGHADGRADGAGHAAHAGHATRAAQPGDAQNGAAVLGYQGGAYALQADGTVSASVSAANGHGHHGNGHEMNLNDIVNAGRRMGMSDEGMRRFVDDFKADGANYNPGQPDDKKTVGAALGLTTAMAIETLNIDGQGLGKADVQRRGAAAVNAAHAGDGAGVREALGGAANRNIEGLTDQDLVNIWGTNTHFYNHNILSASAGRTSDMFQATHLLMRNTEAQDGTAPGTLVGYNDKGEWSQWGWFDNVQALERNFSIDNYR